MLVLTRYSGESIVIGDPEAAADQQIRIKLVGVRGEQVRIGIEAPSGVAIHRSEVVDRIRREGVRRGRSVG